MQRYSVDCVFEWACVCVCVRACVNAGAQTSVYIDLRFGVGPRVVGRSVDCTVSLCWGLWIKLIGVLLWVCS